MVRRQIIEHSCITGMNTTGPTMKFADMVQRLLNGKAKQILDEEFYGLIDHIAEHRDVFAAMSEQERLSFTRAYLEGIL